MGANGFRILANHLGRNSKLHLVLSGSLLQNFSTSGAFSAVWIPRGGLHSKLLPRGSRCLDVVLELKKWVDEGKTIHVAELDRVIREFRKRKRFNDAFEVSQWMGRSGSHVLTPSYHAVHLDLIGHVKGLQAAENYFDKLSEENKTEKTYSSLIHCYAREQSIEKFMSLMEKMKEMGFMSSVLIYNSLMSLYTSTCQYEKVPAVFEDMKKNGAFPDIFSYRICLNSYGARSDLEGMEKVLEEMENQPLIPKDWNSYAIVANVYIKAGLFDQAIASLKKSEANLGKGNAVGCCHLISLYAKLGDGAGMQMLWALLKATCVTVLNRDYLVMLRSLVKIRNLTDAEELLEEWESSGNAPDARVPNVLVAGYCEMDLMEKAEEMVEGMVKKGKYLSPNSWGIISVGYLNKGEIRTAVECMKKALLFHFHFERWKPEPEVIFSLLRWLGDEGEVEEVEGFVGLLKNVVPMNREMYRALLKANIRAGGGVDVVLQRMKADSIDRDEETEGILTRREAN